MQLASTTNPRYEHWRWRVFAITWLAYVGYYLTRKSFSVAKIGMSKDADLGLANYDATQMAERLDGRLGLMQGDMSYIDGAYLIAYALGQFAWGIAGDRVGPRWVVFSGLMLSVVLAVLMGASSLTIWLGVFFCLQGAAQATGWAPLTKNVGNFFSRRERGTMFGFWSTNYAVGGLVASAFAGQCGDRYGWRYAFYIPAATLVVIAILFWLFQRNRPEDVGLEPIEDYHGEVSTNIARDVASDPEHSWAATWSVIANPTVLLLSAVYFLIKPTRYAILFWGPIYAEAKLGTNMMNSGLISGLFEFAGIGSALAAGIVSDRLFRSKRMPVCILCLLLLGVSLVAFDRLPANTWCVGGGFLVLGLLLYAPDSMIAGVAAADFGTKRGASTAAGWINGWGSVGAILGGTIPGYAKQWGWDWSHVFLMFAGFVLLAGLLLAPFWHAMPPGAEEKKRA